MKEYEIYSEYSCDKFYEEFEKRRTLTTISVDTAVKDILENVKSRGDSAVLDYTMTFDGARMTAKEMRVRPGEIFEARSQLALSMLSTLQNAADNIREFHEHELEKSWSMTKDNGSRIGIRVTPVKVAGVYVPGGRAPLPSSVLMNIIPAKVAGVEKIVMCTPPGRDGKINPAILAAAGIAGVDEIYKVGGAQAIAAMAYGTETIPKCDKITGPGNAYVAAAKKAVFGTDGIDMIAGPSEILIIADETADPSYVAADMLSQAEHDPMAASVLITTSEDLAEAVKPLIEMELGQLVREDIARASIDKNGTIIVTGSIDTAVKIANRIAPEHLEIIAKNEEEILHKVQNAGAVFLGKWSPEPMGDYYCGTNHVLPTGGTARYSSPLGVWDFLKRTSIINYTKEDFINEAEEVVLFAKEEGLGAHAYSITRRMEDIEDE
jgi:histidinol dehydrogenase